MPKAGAPQRRNTTELSGKLSGTKFVFDKPQRPRRERVTKDHDRVENPIGPWAMVPKWVFRSVSEGAVILYIVLWYHTDNTHRKAYPSKQTLADEMGCSVDTVDRRLVELQNAKAIRITKRPSTRGGWPHNVYTLRVEKP